MIRRLWVLVVCAVFVAACGDEDTLSLTVQLTASTQPGLDPYAPELGLEVVQVTVDGPDRNDDAIAVIAPDGRTAVVSDYPYEGDPIPLTVRAEGLDGQGNMVAFARAPVIADGDASVVMPLRRNLAYVVHRLNQGQMAPESYVYVIDLNTRGLAQKIRIDGVDPVSTWVTARGGDSILVTYTDGGIGYLGILSAEDHSWQSIELDVPQRVAVGVEGSPIGVVAGGGSVTFVDLDRAEVVGSFTPANGPFGGLVRDGVIAGDGGSALFILGDILNGASAIFVDVNRRTVEPLDVLTDPTGIALSPDGRIAYVTSGVESAVAEVDLANGRVARANGFGRPVGAAAFSENMQAVLALDGDETARRVLALLPRANCPEDLSELCGQPLPDSQATPTTEIPLDLAADGVGRQVLVVGAGSSTTTAGLTLIETFPGARRPPIGARSFYPSDPDDTFQEGSGFTRRQRYQPKSVAIIYGR